MLDMHHVIKIKRVYEPYDTEDGYRILVDRLWPRGIKKESLIMNDWPKELSPSPELRKWFNHDAKKLSVFKEKYLNELNKSEAVLNFLSIAKKNKTITLLYAAADPHINHALILKDFLNDTLNNKTIG